MKRGTEMVKNYFYFIVGLLLILFADTQTLNGLQTVLPVLHGSNIDNSTITVFTYQWHIISMEQVVFGIALIIMAFQNNMTKGRITAWIVIAIMSVRGIIITLVTALFGISNIVNLLTSTIGIFTLVVLLLLGTKVKDK